MRIAIIVFISFIFFMESCTKPRIFEGKSVVSQEIQINTKDDIVGFKDTCVAPIIYTKVISLRKLPVDEKKVKFVEMILPSILIAKHQLNEKIRRIEEIEAWLIENPKMNKLDSLFVSDLFEAYYCTDFVDLKKRLKPHAASIVLGQAALESGWGSSRFFEEGNNIFGIWSYNAGENRIKALVGRDSTSIYVRSYASISESVNDYYGTIARVRAYNEFRQERYNSTESLSLVSFLNRYSELGEVYTKKLRQLIENNDLAKYDSFVLKGDCFKEEIIELSEAN